MSPTARRSGASTVTTSGVALSFILALGLAQGAHAEAPAPSGVILSLKYSQALPAAQNQAAPANGVVLAQNGNVPSPSSSSTSNDFYIPPPRGTPNGRISGGTRGIHGPTTTSTTTAPKTTTTVAPKVKPTTGAGSTNP